MTETRKVVLGGLLLLALVGIVGVAHADAVGCDVLGVLGFPDSCQRACKWGWHSAWANEACFIETILNFT